MGFFVLGSVDMSDLFSAMGEAERRRFAPLAERMRPVSFEEYVGQTAILGANQPLRRLIEQDRVPSMILWGPPGTGKTTLAKLIAHVTKSAFVEVSAVLGGVQEIRQAVKEAQDRLSLHRQRTILFIDEIHRFNKSQQDALLPHVERGVITLIGATTENPSFEVNAALLSRCRVFTLERFSDEEVKEVIVSALGDVERGLGKTPVLMPEDVLQALITAADGDARRALTLLELVVESEFRPGEMTMLSLERLREVLQRAHFVHDKHGEAHHDLISALHKSLRGSDANAGLYWLARMLEAGEDPLYLARRLVRFASEDVGMADPQALVQGVAAFQACHQIGMPECNVILAQLVVYLAQAPKSNALYVAYGAAAKDVKTTPSEPVPLHLRNAPTKLMKELGYGKDYQYPPDYEGKLDQTYLPPGRLGSVYWKEGKREE